MYGWDGKRSWVQEEGLWVGPLYPTVLNLFNQANKALSYKTWVELTYISLSMI